MPHSCCTADGISDKEQCRKTPASVSPKLEGCFKKLEEAIEDNRHYVLITAIFVVVLMVRTIYHTTI